MDTIYTLNARGNFFLDIISEQFKISESRMMTEIQDMFQSTVRALRHSGVDYESLKTALVPSLDRHEAGFIFDSSAIESSLYGREVMFRILPLLEPNSSNSVLVGDLIADDDAQEFVFDLLQTSLVKVRSFEFKHSTLLFCVYVSNLTAASLKNIHQALHSYGAYLGFFPTTHSSPAKNFLSFTLGNR